MRIMIDVHAFQSDHGAYSYMGSEGRWLVNWGMLLGANGHDIHLIGPSYNKSPQGKYDIAILGGHEIPSGTDANLYMFQHFSTQTILEHEGLYKPDNFIIVYPVEAQMHYDYLPPNPYQSKTYFMPTPIAESMHGPNYNVPPSIAWTNKDGPMTSDNIHWHAFVKFAKKYNLYSTIFLYNTFLLSVSGHEDSTALNNLQQEVDSLPNIEKVNPIPINELTDKFKRIKFAFNSHGSGLGGSMLEQVICGVFPLVGDGTKQIFPHLDSKIYNNPYPNTIDGIIENWELALDENFYTETVKKYQEYLQPYLYKNSLDMFYKIISKHGY